MAKHNPYRGKFSGTGRAGESYSVGTLGKGTAHFIFKGKALCQQNKPAVPVHPSSASTICTRCVKIARINAGATAVVPGGRETTAEHGLTAHNSVPHSGTSDKRYAAQVAERAAAIKSRGRGRKRQVA